MNFQAIDEVHKPLASAAKIANKGNAIVLDVDVCNSDIFNKESKQKTLSFQVNGVFVMNVDFADGDAGSAEATFRLPVQVSKELGYPNVLSVLLL